MTKRSSRLLLALPIVALGGLLAAGPVTVAASDLKQNLTEDLQLDRHIATARDLMQDIVHEHASDVADRTRPRSAAPAQRPRAGKRIAPRSRPAEDTAPIARPSRMPTRQLGEHQVPDFLALQDDAEEAREHSGRLPPRK